MANLQENPATANTAAAQKAELEQNAEVAYQEVPTQEEMLNGGKPVAQSQQKPNAKPADKAVTQEIDQALSDAAQDGNIGGG